MFWPQHMGLGWGGWILGGLMMLLFWGGLIALVVYSVRAITRSNQNNTKQTPSEESAFDILKRRYARGEIDKTEYEAIRNDLIQT
ncbi:MAG: SHOCT domain-containing protein [Phycisphaerae bacterium]|nr:SHOCT domain-containing protein [Phycisphaerae bacterium]NIW50293.1 SHOCT domain-containing protein [Gammaproteobacteria bacterium]NIX31543.1 SHOCT domain-containing protein [Phycisphaerae bacterium]